MYARLYACIPELALLPLLPDDATLHDLLTQGNTLLPWDPAPALLSTPPPPFPSNALALLSNCPPLETPPRPSAMLSYPPTPALLSGCLPGGHPCPPLSCPTPWACSPLNPPPPFPAFHVRLCSLHDPAVSRFHCFLSALPPHRSKQQWSLCRSLPQSNVPDQNLPSKERSPVGHSAQLGSLILLGTVSQ